MAYTERVSEAICPLAVMYSDDRGPGIHYSDTVNLGGYHRAWFVLEVGDMGAGATVNAGLQEVDADLATVQNITGKTITALTQAGGDASSLVCIELQTEELDVDDHFENVRFYVTTAVNTVIFSAVLYGVEPRFKPVATTNWAEIVG